MPGEKIKMLKERSQFSRWIKRIGIAGFLFFLIKGLIWIAVFAGVGKLI